MLRVLFQNMGFVQIKRCCGIVIGFFADIEFQGALATDHSVGLHRLVSRISAGGSKKLQALRL